MEILKILEYALAREYEGKRFFEQNADRLSHSAAISAFKQLAQEEQKHIDFIQNQLAIVSHGHPDSVLSKMELEQTGFFSQREKSENLDQSVIEAMVPDLPILRMAYLIERDFAEFYELSALKVDGDSRKVLEMLASWERRHEALFKQFHDRAYDQYAQMPWGG